MITVGEGLRARPNSRANESRAELVRALLSFALENVHEMTDLSVEEIIELRDSGTIEAYS